MGRTKGAKNQPGHKAGGARIGAGRKRKNTDGEDSLEEPSNRQRTKASNGTPIGVDNANTSSQASERPATVPGPMVKLSDIHPDLIPFLHVPHNIPLVCFFDPNRYSPIVQPVDGGQPDTSNNHETHELQLPLQEQPQAGPSTRPIPATAAVSLGDSNGHFETANSDGTVAISTDDTPADSQSPDSESPSASTMPYQFNNVGADGGKRKRRRCLICMNAGRFNHAFICPGRGNRSACATAREIAKHGGTLPPESVKWNSKNTQTPTFVPVPSTVFPFPPPPPGLPMPLPISMPPNLGIPTDFLHPMPPPTTTQPPKPAAPLGYLPNGAARVRRPRRCKICVARGADGTACVGRAAKQRCPYYVEGAPGTEGIEGATSMDQDSDDEDLADQALVEQATLLPDGVIR